MNLIQQMRWRNLFQRPPEDPYADKLVPPGLVGTGLINPPAPVTNPMSVPESAPGLMALRNRPTPLMNQYKEYLGTTPNRQDYELSKVGKALAAGAGILSGTMKGPETGINTFMGLRDAPYATALEDFKFREGNLGKLADLEYKGLTDEAKLALDLGKYDLDRRNQIMNELKGWSGIALDQKQMENLGSLINDRKYSLQQNQVDGQLYVLDQAKNVVGTLGQFMQTPEAKTAMEGREWTRREGISEADRRERQRRQFEHEREMANLRQNLQNEATYRSPQSQRTAHQTAFEQVALENPRLMNELYDMSGPVPVLKPEVATDEELGAKYGTFIDMVTIRKQKVLGRPTSSPRSFFKGTGTGTRTTSSIRTEAIEELKKLGYSEPTEAQIAEAIRDLTPAGTR